jgi:cell division protein ZapA
VHLEKCFNINILGQELSVLTDSGDEHVENVVSYVNNKIEEAGKKVSNINNLNIAILAALNIADEYIKVKGAYNQLESRSEKLINLINEIR